MGKTVLTRYRKGVADAAQTISCEVLAGVDPRVPRVFMEGGQVRAVHALLGGGR